MIVMMAGLPASGKSTVAQAVAERVGGLVLDKDLVRARVFSPEAIEYSTEQDDSVVQMMLHQAESVLRVQTEKIIFLDGRPFSKTYQVDAVVEFAERLGTPWRIVECVVGRHDPDHIDETKKKIDLKQDAKGLGEYIAFLHLYRHIN
jgi:predicted kinase